MNPTFDLEVYNENQVKKKKNGLFPDDFESQGAPPSFRNHFRQKKVYLSIAARVTPKSKNCFLEKKQKCCAR